MSNELVPATLNIPAEIKSNLSVANEDIVSVLKLRAKNVINERRRMHEATLRALQKDEEAQHAALRAAATAAAKEAMAPIVEKLRAVAELAELAEAPSVEVKASAYYGPLEADSSIDYMVVVGASYHAPLYCAVRKTTAMPQTVRTALSEYEDTQKKLADVEAQLLHCRRQMQKLPEFEDDARDQLTRLRLQATAEGKHLLELIDTIDVADRLNQMTPEF
jgi:hypothetical protein